MSGINSIQKGGIYRPEDRHNPAYKGEHKFDYVMGLSWKKPMGRALTFFNIKMVLHDHFDELLYNLSARTNTIKIFALMLLGGYIGNLWYYANYKIKTVEKKWIMSYGQDVPYFVNFGWQ